jgi:hypothetical protein
MKKRLDIKKKLQKMSEKSDVSDRRGTDSPLLKARDPGEIEDGGAGETILDRPASIEDLAIPASVDELEGKGERLEVVRESGELIQTLSLKGNPEISVRWTVFNDPDLTEIDFLKSEGLVRIEENPPIYVLEIGGGTLFVSHVGDYTFSMGGCDIKGGRLLKLFMSGLNNARRFELG